MKVGAAGRQAAASEAKACRRGRAETIASWESPGPGSHYDDVGNPAKSDHVRHSEQVITIHGEEALPEPMLWWNSALCGKSRDRLSSQSSMNYPEAVVYERLDPNASYTIRCGGLGIFLLRIDGKLIKTIHERAELGETRDFVVPRKHLKDRKMNSRGTDQLAKDISTGGSDHDCVKFG